MPSKSASPATVSLPSQIEIFRAGRHTDDSGVVHNFSAGDVAGMVECYDPALREAPLTVGHPAHNLPAYGWVKGLAINPAGNLAMDTHQVQPQFAEMVDAKLFKKRSASFYPPSHTNNPKPGKWYLRHVAFLGAQPPAIAGLSDFAESDSTGTVSFSESDPLFNQEQIRMTKELQDQLAASQAQAAISDAARTKAEGEAAEANAKLAQFAEAAHRDRVAGFVSFCDAQIKTGCLLPKEKDAAVAVLTTLADSKEVSFAESGATKTVAAVDWLKGLIERAKPAVSFGEHAAGTLSVPGSAAGLSDAEIDTRAKAYARDHKVNYAEALTAVVGFTS
jgi:hypothetical protein